MIWERVLLVALAGAAGSVLRYGVTGLVDDRLGSTVLGTFVVNVSGALLLGLLLGVTEERWLATALVPAHLLCEADRARPFCDPSLLQVRRTSRTGGA
ncbi:MAG: CrcB family protein [Chloroflexi bacterium]|nr:CrcB family protein [Chloroflexota bacterium]MCI0889257.1 CrcB family protein [Chloroflexota bacterium]